MAPAVRAPHTAACRSARQGCRPRAGEVRTDWPWLSDVRAAHGPEGIEAVLACPSPDHESVRFLAGRNRL